MRKTFLISPPKWHWHRAIELFHVESGAIEYNTPEGNLLFPAGSGGMVNANVLHMTKALARAEKNIVLIHLFDSSLIAGETGSKIEQKYITPLVTAKQIEILSFFPENTAGQRILPLIRSAFHISEKERGYEIKLRETLSNIWLLLFDLAQPLLTDKKSPSSAKNSNKIKQMLIYIHEHFSEKLSVTELAGAAFISERECFRVFHDCLHMTPAEYIKSYRMQMACQMLVKTTDSITSISHACGLGGSSYFGKVFRESLHCTPLEYRRKWQDCDR